MLMSMRVPHVVATVAVVAILGGCALHDPYPVDTVGIPMCHPPDVHVVAAGQSTRLRAGKTLRLTVPAHTRIHITARGDCSDSVRLNSPNADRPTRGSSTDEAQITTQLVLWVPCKEPKGNKPAPTCPLIEFGSIEVRHT